LYQTNHIYRTVEKIIAPIYEVGGSVRDGLRGVEPADFDFATPLSPDIIEQSIRAHNRRPFLTGKRFGTIGVKLEGVLVEITTFRVERYHEGTRNPEVSFVKDLVEDLGRRDFTINAMAKKGGRLIDPFGGREDLEGRIIRCVGNPSSRFKEDPLRMLRALRFAAQLGFEIEETSKRAISRSAYRILQVSKERWVAELDKVLLAENCEKGLRYFMDTGLCRFIIPELALQKGYDQKSKYHAHTLWEHTIAVTVSVPAEIHLRWAALLHDIAKPFVGIEKEGRRTYAKHDLLGYEMVRRLGAYFRWSNKRIDAVSALVGDHMKDTSPLRSADNNSKV